MAGAGARRRGSRERFVEALRAGGRYVRNALIVRRLLYRAILFIPAASAVWALLPVVAAHNLGLGSGGYGLLLGMVGVGAVAGAFVIPRLRASVGSARLVTGAMLVTAAAIAVVATVGNPVLVGIALVPIGGVVDRGHVEPELRACSWPCRTGSGPAAWPPTWSCSRAPRRWGRSSGERSRTAPPRRRRCSWPRLSLWRWPPWSASVTPMPDTSTLDRTPSAHWPAPQLTIAPNADDGPVLVTLTYRVPEDNAVAFTTPCGTSAGHGGAPARCDGSCSATAAIPPDSSSPTSSGPGRSTGDNTRTG